PRGSGRPGSGGPEGGGSAAHGRKEGRRPRRPQEDRRAIRRDRGGDRGEGEARGAALRIAFCGTGAFGAPSLRALVSACEVALVVTQPERARGRSRAPGGSPIKLVAQELGLRVEQPERLSD